MESKYIINVAENMGNRSDNSIRWQHFFRVDAGSSYEKAQDILHSLRNAYPENSVTVTYWKAEGKSIEM